MIFQTLINNFREVYGVLNSNRRKYKKTIGRLDRLEAAIAALSDSIDPNFDVTLGHIAPIVPLIITRRLEVAINSSGGDRGSTFVEYYKARRIELDPAPYTSPSGAPNRWRIDPDFDTKQYVVMAAPGTAGLFPGCRVFAMLAHEARIFGPDPVPTIVYEGEVYLPISGEHQGFWARLSGPPEDGDPFAAMQFYHWDQFGATGLLLDDCYYNGLVIPGVDGAPDFTMPKALQLESMSRDPAALTHIPVATNAIAWLRWAPEIPGSVTDPTWGFVFNHATYPLSEPCPVP